MNPLKKSARWQVMGYGIIACLGLASCGLPGESPVPSGTSASSAGLLRIGTGLTPETRHAAYIYQAALQEAGYSVEVLETGEGREAVFEQMQIDLKSAAQAEPTATSPAEGAVHIIPDLSGDLLLYLTDNGSTSPSIINEGREQARATAQASDQSHQPEITATSTAGSEASPSPSATQLNVRGLSSNDIVGYVDLALPETVELLNPSASTDRYGYVVTSATAQKYGLKSMSDLGEHCNQLSVVAPETYTINPSGKNSLQDYYGCTPGDLHIADNQQEQTSQLITGQTDLAYMFSASADLPANNLTLLSDPERTQLAQKIVPLTRAGEVPQEARDIINAVSAQITSDSLVRLNSLTSGDRAVSETDAAHFWLSTLKR